MAEETVEKKAEKQNEYILTSEGDSTETSQIGLPVLVPEANKDSVEPSATPQSFSKPSANQESLKSDKPALANKNFFSDKIFKHYRRLIPILTLIVIVVVWSPVKQALSWYLAAPRPGNFNAVVFVPAVLSAWLGDPDTAYAVQVAPIMMGPDNLTKEDPKRRASRDISVKIAERFLAGPGDSKKSLTRVIDSVALSMTGRSVDAQRVVAPIMSEVANPMLKAYNAILFAANGDMKTAIAEADKGIALVRVGNGMNRSTDMYSLIWVKSQCLQAIGEPRKALECANTVAEIIAANISATQETSLKYCKASAYLQLGEPDQVIRLLRGDGDLDHVMLSRAYLMKNEYDTALSEANKIAKSTKYPTGVTGAPTEEENNLKALALSRIYTKQKSFGEALKYAEEAQKLEPTVVNLEQHVYVLNALGRYWEATYISQNMLESLGLQHLSSGVFECLPDLYAGRAEAYARLGNADQAFAQVNEALKINPHCRRALEAGLLAATSQGDTAKVQAYKKKIGELPLVPSYR